MSELAQLTQLIERTDHALQLHAARAVDSSLVVRNWLIGWYIVEFEQNGKERATYGSGFLKALAQSLKESELKGLSLSNLKLFRSFYLDYPPKGQTLSNLLHNPLELAALEKGQTVSGLSQGGSQELPQNFSNVFRQLANCFPLSWSHYVALLAIKNLDERSFYEIEAAANNWSLRELKRQINSSLYERLALSRDQEQVKKLSLEGQIVETAADLIKNPYVLEFLYLEEKASYSEKDLETAIIDRLEHFLLELGKGFLFEARQKRFTFEEDHYYVDLVFYNRLLRCYTLIDLKIGELTHQDLGQMQMYVNYYDRHVKLKDENPTVGIILCKRKKDALVEITLPESTNIHASEYQLYLPSKAELEAQIESATRQIEDEQSRREDDR